MPDNSVDNKRIAKNTIFLYFRSILIMLISLYTSRIVLAALGVEDYGIYNVVGGVVTMFSMISGTLASATQRFITYALGEKDDEKSKRVFSNSLTLHIVLGLIIVMLLEIMGVWLLYNKLNIPSERIDVANIVLQCSIFTLFFNMVAIPYNAMIIAHEKMSAFAYISILEVGLKLAIALLLLSWDYDKLIFYAVLHLVTSVVLRSIYSIYSRRHFTEAKNISLRIDKELFKQMFAFAGWNLLGSGSLVLRNQGVDIVLNLFFGVTVNAAKGICNQVQHAVGQFAGNFNMALKPQLTKSVAQHNSKRVYELIIQGTRFSFYLMALFTVPIIISCDELLSLWLVKTPDYTSEFVRWTMVYLLLDVQSKLLTHAVLSKGDIRNYQIVVGGTKLLAVPLVYMVLMCGGSPITGILVNILLEAVCLCLRLYYNKRMLGLPVLAYVKSAFVKCYFVLLAALIAPYFLYKTLLTNPWIILPASLFSIMVCIYFMGLNRQERAFVRTKTRVAITKHIHVR